jgi:hypothetical protein
VERTVSIRMACCDASCDVVRACQLARSRDQLRRRGVSCDIARYVATSRDSRRTSQSVAERRRRRRRRRVSLDKNAIFFEKFVGEIGRDYRKTQ